MHALTRICVLTALVSAWPVFANPTGAVTVEFVQPEKFTDINEQLTRSAPEKNAHLHNLRKYTETRAARYLTGGQTLEIRYTDIDLAGDHHPQVDPSMSDVRVVTSLYPPRLKFTWALHDAGGGVLKSGTEDLRDLGFETGSSANFGDALRYEKRMLDKWMRATIGGQ